VDGHRRVADGCFVDHDLAFFAQTRRPLARDLVTRAGPATSPGWLEKRRRSPLPWCCRDSAGIAFMLVAPGSMESWSGLIEREPPEAVPQLPEAVTTAWAADYRSDGRPVVWRARRPGRWEVLL